MHSGLTIGQVQIAHVLALRLAKLNVSASPRGEICDTLRKDFDVKSPHLCMLDLVEALDLSLSVDKASTHVARQERLLKISEILCDSAL